MLLIMHYGLLRFLRFELHHHYYFPHIINTSHSNISWITTLIYLGEIKCLATKGNVVHTSFITDID